MAASGTGSSPTGSANARLAPQLCYISAKEPSEPVKAATIPGVTLMQVPLVLPLEVSAETGEFIKKVSNYAEQFIYPSHHMCADCDLSGGFCSTPFSKLPTNIPGNQSPAPGSTC